jgi:hypothetical protein
MIYFLRNIIKPQLKRSERKVNELQLTILVLFFVALLIYPAIKLLRLILSSDLVVGYVEKRELKKARESLHRQNILRESAIRKQKERVVAAEKQRVKELSPGPLQMVTMSGIMAELKGQIHDQTYINKVVNLTSNLEAFQRYFEDKGRMTKEDYRFIMSCIFLANMLQGFKSLTDSEIHTTYVLLRDRLDKVMLHEKYRFGVEYELIKIPLRTMEQFESSSVYLDIFNHLSD